MLRILLLSDTHLGITTAGEIEVVLKNAKLEEFDIIIHAGDYSGGLEAYKKVKGTVELIRKHFPHKPYLSVLGNHDFWFKGRKRPKSQESVFFGDIAQYGRPSSAQFASNVEKIEKIFKDNNVHFLDNDGIYNVEDEDQVVYKIFGSSGWYQNPSPPTNDELWLPIGLEGDTNRFLLNRAEKILGKNLDLLDANYKPTDRVIFVSHFPVVNCGDDYKGAFEKFSWRESICTYLQEQYKCTHFINGHAHQLHKGPLRWECGSDYRRPKYMIMEIE